MSDLFETVYWAVNIDEYLVLEQYQELFFTFSVVLLAVSLIGCFTYYLIVNNGTLQTVLNSITSWIIFGGLTSAICLGIGYSLIIGIYQGEAIDAAAKNFLTMYFCYSFLIYLLASLFVKKLSLNANRTPF